MTVEEKIKAKEEKQRHDEMVSLFKELNKVMPKLSGNNAEITKALNENNQALLVTLKGIVEAFKGVDFKPEIMVNSPEVKVDNSGLLNAINDQNKLLEGVLENQANILDALGRKPTRMEVVRNDYGTLKFIDIKYK